MAKAIVTETGEILIDDPERPVIRFVVVDHDLSLYCYSLTDLKAYYEMDEDVFTEIVAGLQENGFHKRYDDESGVSVFGIGDFASFEEQLQHLELQ